MPAQPVSAAGLPGSQKRPDSALSGPWPRPPPFSQGCPVPSHPGRGSSGHHCSITPLKCVPSWKPCRHLLRKSLKLYSPGCLDTPPSTSKSKLGTKLSSWGLVFALLKSTLAGHALCCPPGSLSSKAIQALWANHQSLPSPCASSSLPGFSQHSSITKMRSPRIISLGFSIFLGTEPDTHNPVWNLFFTTVSVYVVCVQAHAIEHLWRSEDFWESAVSFHSGL